MDMNELPGLLHHHCRVATGVNLHVVERPGHGRPIILLHGMWGMWRSWLRLLEEQTLLGRPLFALDLRGHGFSDHPEAGYSLPDYASDIDAFVDQFDAGPVSLIGHSLGALVGLELLATAPEHIDKVVLEEPPLPLPDENTPIAGFWQEFIEALIGFYLLKHEPLAVIAEELMKAVDWMTPELAEEGAYYVSHTADGVFTAVMREEITLDDVEQLAQPLTVPTLIVQGTKLDDRALTDRGVDMLRRYLADATVVSFPDTGHVVHSAVPDEFQRTVAAFLA
jgi:pimeloyl-ACP methyl ester carboxylesterase